MTKKRRLLPYILLSLIIAGALIATGILLTQQNTPPEEEEVATTDRLSGYSVVLDAGHGGFDPGAIGAAGTIEAELNLQISEKLQTLLENEGATVTMTRTDAEAVGEDKDTDMDYRREVIETSGQNITVSIHQNKYEDTSVSGPQVFYNPGSVEGEKLAKAIQQSMIEQLEPPNERSAVAQEYFITQSGAAPAVIVECGFISNPQEEGLLITEEYQDMLAAAIVSGIYNYYTGTQA